MFRCLPDSATPCAWFPGEKMSIASDNDPNDSRTLTGTASDDALPSLLLRQIRHEIESTAYLEAEDLLEVFSLQPYLIAEFRA